MMIFISAEILDEDGWRVVILEGVAPMVLEFPHRRWLDEVHYILMIVLEVDVREIT